MDVVTSKNPATGAEICQQPSFDPSKLKDVVVKARQVQQTQWRSLSFKERAAFLSKGQAYLLDHMDEIAQSISKNNGKPLVESISAEILPMLQTFGFAIKKAAKILKDEPLSSGPLLITKRAYITHQPMGVIGIISPWNYPLSTPLAEIILSLMAGNAVIIKPSEVTGLVNEQIQKIVDSMQLPQGLFTMVHGRGEVGAALVSSGVDRIILTGSVATGKKVMAQASQTLTPVTLELGGKDCMIVLDDANLDVAASAAVVGGFYNAGQTCCSVERLLVHEKVAPEFLKLFTAKLEKLRVGESKGFENDLGPVTFDGQKKVYLTQVQDHVAHNEKTLFGEPNYDGKSNFMNPLVVQVQNGSMFWKDETFGPVVALKTFKTDEEAIALNNNSTFGLAALVWSGNNKRAQAIGRQLNVGTVVINDAPFTNACATYPWGGVGESGMGRVHGEIGLKELCHTRVIVYDVAGQAKQFWWFPYNEAQYEFFKSVARLFSGKGIGTKLKALVMVIKNLMKMGPRL